MKVIILEDSQNDLEKTGGFLSQFFREKKIPLELQSYRDGTLLVSHYDSQCDLLVLDIDVPGVSGMDVARKIRETDERVAILFTTNLTQYAVEGYEVSALDYIVKPFDYFVFSRKMQKFLSHVEKEENKSILLNSRGNYQKIPVQEILYIEVLGHKLFYHTLRDNYEIRGTIREAEENLRSCHFARCNNCFLVNLGNILAIEGNRVILPGKKLQISRYKKKQFIDDFTNYMNA